jgi:prophage antirepressor-like protein
MAADVQSVTTVTFRADGVPASPIRAFSRGGHPWLVASDICRIAGVRTEVALKSVPEEHRGHATVLDKGRVQAVAVVSDVGFDALLSQASGHAAKALRNWIAHQRSAAPREG